MTTQRRVPFGAFPLQRGFERVPDEFKADLERIIDWCEFLEGEALAKTEFNGRRHTNLAIHTYCVKGVELAKVNYMETDARGPWLYLNGSKLRQYAPRTISLLSERAGRDLTILNRAGLIYLSKVSDELLAALTQAYREANGHLGNEGQSQC